MARHGHVYWSELQTRDVESVKRLYAETFGWSFDAMEMEDGLYWVARRDEEMVCGLFEMQGPDFEGVPTLWMTYFAVDDLDGTIGRAEALGLQVLREPWDVPGVGRIAILRQPDGAMVGWITPEDE